MLCAADDEPYIGALSVGTPYVFMAEIVPKAGLKLTTVALNVALASDPGGP
jgi:hypothetical protein